MRAAPPIGYNLTYSCPEGMVFDHDWFATPFVMLTCQVYFIKKLKMESKEKPLKDNGEFEVPDWDSYSCVFRKQPFYQTLNRSSKSIFSNND